MAQIIRTVKLHIHPDEAAIEQFKELTTRYAEACNDISQYIFDNGFPLSCQEVQKNVYSRIRDGFGLKAQMTISAIKTVTAKYKTLKEQMTQKPYRCKDEQGKWISIPRTLEWAWYPIHFQRPQADLVRGRDYSFVDGGSMLSINTLEKRVKVSFDMPECFQEYFGGEWKLGTAKLLSSNGKWYLHIPATRTIPDTFDPTAPVHIVGIDRGLRFVMVTYDDNGACEFFSGEDIMKKRDNYAARRAELQARGTRSAKRKLKALSGRENRWMTDVNHRLSKTLVQRYGKGTLFAVEDLTGVSFNEENLASRRKGQRSQLRSWAFYQLEQFLTCKAQAAGSGVMKFPANYTSQRCPKCGRIHKENRKSSTHEYVCDVCGYRSNDDRVGSMNVYELAVMYVAGDPQPGFEPPKTN